MQENIIAIYAVYTLLYLQVNPCPFNIYIYDISCMIRSIDCSISIEIYGCDVWAIVVLTCFHSSPPLLFHALLYALAIALTNAYCLLMLLINVAGIHIHKHLKEPALTYILSQPTTRTTVQGRSEAGDIGARTVDLKSDPNGIPHLT